MKNAKTEKVMLNPTDFKKSIQTIEALGMTPAVLVKAIEMAQDPNTDMENFSALLRNDGPLSADIIRISNSPYYAPATPHSNLLSAISQLGFGEVIHVINLSLARQLFARDLPSYGVLARDYWSASITAALVMEALAQVTDLVSEDAYTVGILHPIGRVLINHVIEEKGFSIYWDCQRPIEEWELAAVGFNFADAGALLLEHWRFPAAICDVIRNQLVPVPDQQTLTMAGILQFAKRLLALTGPTFQFETWEYPVNDPFIQAARLSEPTLRELVSGCRDNYRKILQTVDFP